jgi:hypothetical protein
MIRPLLSLDRLSFLASEGQVGYRYGQAVRETETMDYLEFIARVTSHIPARGQVTVRYYGLYANAHRGKVRKASLMAFPLQIVEDELRSSALALQTFLTPTRISFILAYDGWMGPPRRQLSRKAAPPESKFLYIGSDHQGRV